MAFRDTDDFVLVEGREDGRYSRLLSRFRARQLCLRLYFGLDYCRDHGQEEQQHAEA